MIKKTQPSHTIGSIAAGTLNTPLPGDDAFDTQETLRNDPKFRKLLFHPSFLFNIPQVQPFGSISPPSEARRSSATGSTSKHIAHSEEYRLT